MPSLGFWFFRAVGAGPQLLPNVIRLTFGAASASAVWEDPTAFHTLPPLLGECGAYSGEMKRFFLLLLLSSAHLYFLATLICLPVTIRVESCVRICSHIQEQEGGEVPDSSCQAAHHVVFDRELMVGSKAQRSSQDPGCMIESLGSISSRLSPP